MIPVPEGPKPRRFRAGLAAIVVLAAVAIVLHSAGGRNGPTHAPHPPPGPAPEVLPTLRLEPAPPVSAEMPGLRGRPLLLFKMYPQFLHERELPLLNRFRRQWGPKGLEVIGLYLGPRSSGIEALLRDFRVGWRVFHQAPGAPFEDWLKLYGTASGSQVVLLDAAGSRAFAGGTWGLGAALEKALGPPAAAPETVSAVRGRLVHLGRPLPEFTDSPAEFGPFRDEATGKLGDQTFRVNYDRATGEFRVLAIPEGTWGVYVTCGPFWHNFVVFTATPGSPRESVIELTRRIYLRKPVDTSKDVPDESAAFHRSPVTFEWDPVPGADSYAARVRRRPLDQPESQWSVVVDGRQKEPLLPLDIEEGFQYEFEVTAYAGTARAATLRVYQTGLGSSYRFRAGDPPVEKPGR